MEFDIEALRGIIDTLPPMDEALLRKEATKRLIWDTPRESEQRRVAVQALLVELVISCRLRPARLTPGPASMRRLWRLRKSLKASSKHNLGIKILAWRSSHARHLRGIIPEAAKERRDDLKAFVVSHGSRDPDRDFQTAWQEAVDAAVPVVEGWLAEDANTDLAKLPDEMLISLME